MSDGRVGADGVFEFGAARFRAALGRGGITAAKREGDGATPSGVLPLRRILYRADRARRPRTDLPTMPIAPHDAWCDDPEHPDYNTLVRLPHDGRHEQLWRSDGIYDVLAVLGWNDSPVERGRGSAIFLHVARPAHTPTDGCIAMTLGDLLAVLGGGLTRIIVEPHGDMG